jgi:hypothetical protein
MSLTGPEFWSPDKGAVMPVGAGQRCFFCEDLIKREPSWTWVGSSGQIWLHPGCVADFATRMFADLLHWQQRGKRRFHEIDE